MKEYLNPANTTLKILNPWINLRDLFYQETLNTVEI